MLETQELEDAQVNGRMESQSALVRTKGRVELNTVSTVDLWLSHVIFPYNTELDNALGDGDDLEGSLVFGILLE